MALTTNDLQAELIDRGVNPTIASEVLEQLDPETVAQTIRWFDDQHGRVTAGVLVIELRAGGKPGYGEAALDRDQVYGQQIVTWLRKHLPETCDEHGHPHYAAIAAVIRLEHRYGKGNLSAGEHGQAIRGAVEDARAEAEAR